MPTYQKISLDGSKLVFSVTPDEGLPEVCTYMLDGKESEDELMARVALHIQGELDARKGFQIEETPAEPVMEVSVSQAGKVSVKEVVDEPVA